MARYHGKNAAIYISTTGSGTASKLAVQTSWSLDGSTDKVDVTAFGDPNMIRLQGLPDRKGDFAGFWDDTETKLWSAIDSADGAKLYLYPDVVNKATSYFYGPALVDAKMDAGVKDAIKVAGSWVANGAWGRNAI